MFHIITNCGPCEEYIGRCIASIRDQSFTDWQAHCTVDPCGDDTYRRAQTARDGDPRIRIHRNPERRYAAVNVIRAIERSGAAPEDVMVVLDGDDWFATPDALRIIHETYRRTVCWMTYGSWIADRTDLEEMRSGRWPAYPAGTTDFRNAEWLGTAVRTWKRWLWGLIDDRDLRDAAGSYFRVTEDQAIMMPMLEMSGTGRARHIEDVLMVYNRSSPHAVGLTRCDEMLANSRYIRSLPPYAPLAGVPVSATVRRSLRSARAGLRKTQQCCIS